MKASRDDASLAPEAQQARERLCVALDVPTLPEAVALARAVAPDVGVVKVGLELFVKHGPEAVHRLATLGFRVFLDLKLHDIPATVLRATQSAITLGASYLTLHASGGPTMLEAAARAVREAKSPLNLLAVTVLTSHSAAELSQLGLEQGVAVHAQRLARLALGAGARGLVCSVEELSSFRQTLGPNPLLVTPGIRPEGTAPGDQARVGTPLQAVRQGASLLVVGRPIRDAAQPEAAARAIRLEIQRALTAA